MIERDVPPLYKETLALPFYVSWPAFVCSYLASGLVVVGVGEVPRLGVGGLICAAVAAAVLVGVEALEHRSTVTVTVTGRQVCVTEGGAPSSTSIRITEVARVDWGRRGRTDDAGWYAANDGRKAREESGRVIFVGSFHRRGRAVRLELCDGTEYIVPARRADQLASAIRGAEPRKRPVFSPVET